MEFLKSFDQFINEGASVDAKGQVILNPKDDPKNNDEVLKSSSGGVRFFKEIGLPGRERGRLMFPKFFSLSASDYTGPVDHPGRFKYTMDQLKNSNIVDAETSIPEFIKSSFMSIGIIPQFIPDYLVAVGSTSGLVAQLCDGINQALGKKLPIISLPKIKYLNAGEAINWEEVRNQMKRQAGEKNPEGIKTLNVAKNILLHYISTGGKGATHPELVKAIKKATSVDELETLVYGKNRYISPDTAVKWKQAIAGEEMVPFKVRSSGRNFGGGRKFWHGKYDFNEAQFLKGVTDCAKSVFITPTRPKKMLIVDDNINTGEDARTIKENIREIIEEIYPIGSFDYPKYRKSAEMQFGFYVLYDMKTDSDFSYTIAGDPEKYNKYPVSAKAVSSFAQLKNLPLP